MDEVIFLIDTNEMPKGFQSALSKNFCAMKYVSELPPRKQKRVIAKAKELKTQDEIRDYIIKLAGSLRI